MKNPAGPGTRGAGTGGASGVADGGAAAAIPMATPIPGPGAASASGPADVALDGSCRSQPVGLPTTGPAGGASADVSGAAGGAVSGPASDASTPGTGSFVAGTRSISAGTGSPAAGTRSAVVGTSGTDGPADFAGPPASPKTEGAWAGGTGVAQGAPADAPFAGAGAWAGACGSLTGHPAPDGRPALPGRTCLVTPSLPPGSRPVTLVVDVGLAWRPTFPGPPAGSDWPAEPGRTAGVAFPAGPAAFRTGACRSSWAILAGAVSAATTGAASLTTVGVNPAGPRAPAAHCGTPPRFSAGRRSRGAGAARGTRVGWPAGVA